MGHESAITAHQQNRVIQVLELYHDEDGFDRGLNLLYVIPAIYGVHRASPAPGDPRKSVYPLFPSTGYMNLTGAVVEASDGYFVKGALCFPFRSRLPERLFLTIEEGDLTELENIDPHRAWRTETPFQTGLRWDFKSHQLRRSLALYAQRSGLVSLPSLRRQLHRLTEEMSRYYAKGSAYAANFIGAETGHFGHEWQQTQLESSALGYILNVLQTEDVLIGGHASWIERHAKPRDEKVLLDRATTMLRFKKGEMAFRETLLGGCTSTEGCNQIAVTSLNIECLRDNCKNLVCNASKLERVVIAQERLVANIAPDSVEHRTELADLQVLRDAMAIVALKKQERRA